MMSRWLAEHCLGWLPRGEQALNILFSSVMLFFCYRAVIDSADIVKNSVRMLDDIVRPEDIPLVAWVWIGFCSLIALMAALTLVANVLLVLP